MTEKKLECNLSECIRACDNYRAARDVRCCEPKNIVMCDLYGCPTEYHGPVPPKAYLIKQALQIQQIQQKVITQ